VRAIGWFGSDWSLDKGDIVWNDGRRHNSEVLITKPKNGSKQEFFTILGFLPRYPGGNYPAYWHSYCLEKDADCPWGLKFTGPLELND
jgi:hypothetical protein